MGWFVERGKLYGILELLDHSIFDELAARERGLAHHVLREYTYQILQGAHFLHRKNIIHRDIKPENLLVSLSGVVKLADLGYSRKVLMNSVNLTSWAGTPVYMPPEILLGETKYSTPVDVWAIGCTILVMAKYQTPFSGQTYLALVRDMMATIGPLTELQQCRYLAQCRYLPPVQPPSEPTKKYKLCDKQLAELIEACLQMEPSKRSSCSQLLSQDYFTWDHFPDRFTKDMELMVQRDRECCVPPRTGTQPTSTPSDNSTRQSSSQQQAVNLVGMMTLSSQLQDGSKGMKNLEGAKDKPPQTRGMSEESQDKPPQTRGNEEPAEEVELKKRKKKKKNRGFTATFKACLQVDPLNWSGCSFQPQAPCVSWKTGIKPARTTPDNSTRPSQQAVNVEVVTPFSQLKDGSQGMENLEESQDKPPQTRGVSEEPRDKTPQTRRISEEPKDKPPQARGNEEPAEEVELKKKKKRSFTATFKACLQMNPGNRAGCSAQPQAPRDSGKTGAQPASSPPDYSTRPSQQAESVVELVTPFSQLQDGSQGMENLEEAQEERDEEPAEETELRKKKKKGFTATFRRAVNAVRRHFTSRVSPMQG
ncbi:cyclin-dependent kinase-like 3 [Gadus chalcogrammus]|uniref:cyclin-dependent kinase-like 3 n=1 Tax=Gadus chalcogrammus TaxID=1042646 RepID=UPI0024C4622B|nr:cyclin-dependent kinase-like 3 [Gadus chalcogrammus]